MRRYVAAVRGKLFRREAIVHRTHAPGETMEVDFGNSLGEIARQLRRVKFFVATLPASNAYFAKAYPVERLEALLDGLAAAFAFFGGVPERVVLDNTRLAVKRILAGRDREETDAFEAFRGAYPFRAEFCAPAKGWEKGSVEGGVQYVRDLALRPMVQAPSWAALNAYLEAELHVDLPRRRLPDGRTTADAWAAEREHLRPLPAAPPETCRRVARVIDKFGHVRVDHVAYSVPIAHAYRPAWVKLFADRAEVVVADTVVATHARAFRRGTLVLEPRHVLPLLAHKARAAGEATALQGPALPPVFGRLRTALATCVRYPEREWVQVLQLLETAPEAAVVAAVEAALAQGTPRLETVRLLLRQALAPPGAPVPPVPLTRADLAAVTVAPPILAAYDTLGGRDE